MTITDVLQLPNFFSIHLPLILDITTSLPINAFIAVLPSKTTIFGSIISILIISIFLFIAFRVIKRVINLNNNFYKLALSGLISLLIFQTFIHIGVNANLLPTTGMTLPFLSYGGSSIISTAIISGIILNLTKRKLL